MCGERWVVLGAGCCVWGEEGGAGSRMLCGERWVVLGAGCCVWGEVGGARSRMLRVGRGGWC